jgi:hypothetical protein
MTRSRLSYNRYRGSTLWTTDYSLQFMIARGFASFRGSSCSDGQTGPRTETHGWAQCIGSNQRYLVPVPIRKFDDAHTALSCCRLIIPVLETCLKLITGVNKKQQSRKSVQPLAPHRTVPGTLLYRRRTRPPTLVFRIAVEPRQPHFQFISIPSDSVDDKYFGGEEKVRKRTPLAIFCFRRQYRLALLLCRYILYT